MSRDKQIEEMAKVLSTVKRCNVLCVSECIKNKCAYPHYEGVTCIAEHQAEALYNAGYRKANEVARDILDEAYEILKELKDEYRLNEETREACAVRNAMFKLAELKDKYTESGRDKIAEFGKYSPYSWKNTEDE